MESPGEEPSPEVGAQIRGGKKGVYTAPQSTETFEHVFSTTTGTLAAKQAHLSELQLLVPKLQDQINAFLTERMEEDKKVQGKLSAQEAKEEENYGEEVVEDDA